MTRNAFGTRGRRVAMASAIGIASAVAMASSAVAADPPAPYTDFKNCPYTNLDVQTCLYSQTTSGSFKLGNADVPINKTITLQGGFRRIGTTADYQFYNAVGAKTLAEVPLDVPGGLTGLVVPSQITAIPILGPLFTAAVNSVNGVTATAQLVGPVGFSFANFNLSSGTAISLPIKIHLENPFLGSSCYIGSNSNPVTLNLTTGTTAPPAPNTPITGTPGLTQIQPGGITAKNGLSLVDNSFTAPAAQDCGPWGFRWAVTPIVNLKEGLPAAAGKNTAIQSGNLKLASATTVRNSVGG
jgi:hypothetical protein